jgi:hypothetical protein
MTIIAVPCCHVLWIERESVARVASKTPVFDALPLAIAVCFQEAVNGRDNQIASAGRTNLLGLVFTMTTITLMNGWLVSAAVA